MALHRMIEVCPVLRELHLFMIDGLHRIIFHSSTLATMSISSPCVPLDEFSTWDMPALQSVTFSYIDLWRVPVFTINVGNGRLREIGLKLPNLDSPSLNIVANKCFHFCSNNEVGFGDWEPASEAVISQKNKHLTYIRLSGYCGTVGEVDFVRYIMVRMQSLRSMDICHSVDWTPEDIRHQTDSICIGGKASPFAQLYCTRSVDSDDARRKAARFLHSVPML